jgi:predicted CDP-diglyceride synthetase/phosphatidate cytidylyltransferase
MSVSLVDDTKVCIKSSTCLEYGWLTTFNNMSHVDDFIHTLVSFTKETDTLLKVVNHPYSRHVDEYGWLTTFNNMSVSLEDDTKVCIKSSTCLEYGWLTTFNNMSVSLVDDTKVCIKSSTLYIP